MPDPPAQPITVMSQSVLKPDRLEILPSSPNAVKIFSHWFFIFEKFADNLTGSDTAKLGCLANCVSVDNFSIIAGCTTLSQAVTALKAAFIQPQSEVVARHVLATRKQKEGESLADFLRALLDLTSDCNFTEVSATNHRDLYVRDALITGLASSHIRTRLLENRTLTLQEAYDKARALEVALKDSQSHATNSLDQVASVNVRPETSQTSDLSATPGSSAAATNSWTCFNCGSKQRHPRSKCPARNSVCGNCSRRGHYAAACRSKAKVTAVITSHEGTDDDTLFLASVPASLRGSEVEAYIEGHPVRALVDSGSSLNFISENCAKELKINITPYASMISMAAEDMQKQVSGVCNISFTLMGFSYSNTRFFVLKSLCTDVILGRPLMRQHSNVVFKCGGNLPALEVCGLTALEIEPVSVFKNMSPDCRPILTKSRRFNQSDSEFIRTEIKRLLAEDIIEPSESPWRAQIVLVKKPSKTRLYSRTCNRFTLLDGYPLPNIEQLITNIACYNVYSTIDLTSAYHLVPLTAGDRPYTAFEANGRLYQFKRLSFGLTNGVSAFQRVMDKIIQDEGLQGTFAYLDDVTICGKDQADHDKNLEAFFRAAKKYKMAINHEKSRLSSSTLRILGYEISNGLLRPDPSRLEALKSMPLPTTPKGLLRAMGLFAYYSKWISLFSERMRPLVTASFPLSNEAIDAFSSLKKAICSAVISRIDENLPFCIETDESDSCLGATLSQDGRPVAFFSRSLSPTEKKHSPVEKEAYAIVESVRKWRHFLLARRFKIITDQRSVHFMFTQNHKGKIKNEKILRWRLELMPFVYDIQYRPGPMNTAADALSRQFSASTTPLHLMDLHKSLCHPGVRRLYHFVQARNLPFSLDQVKSTTASCITCCKLKPRFYKPTSEPLIKSLRPFDRLSIDFKGPLPSSTPNKYILIVVDEYSRYPFAFPCKELSTHVVIKCLQTIFSLFGLPSYIHSDRGRSFVSQELQKFLTGLGIATSRSTPYHPTGNSQCERYVGIVWKTILLALESKRLPVTQWENVVVEALHSIRSLLCTSTNCTPHERVFNYPRRTATGLALPEWLMRPGTVLYRSHRRLKSDPLVEEVQLIHANPQYANVRFRDGREDTVSIRDLAPAGISENSLPSEMDLIPHDEQNSMPRISETSSSSPASNEPPAELAEAEPPLDTFDGTPGIGSRPPEPQLNNDTQPPDVRRGSRIRKPRVILDL